MFVEGYELPAYCIADMDFGGYEIISETEPEGISGTSIPEPGNSGIDVERLNILHEQYTKMEIRDKLVKGDVEPFYRVLGGKPPNDEVSPCHPTSLPSTPPIEVVKREKNEDQPNCCIKGCGKEVHNRNKGSLKLRTHIFKDKFLKRNWFKICHYHYFSDLYRAKKKKEEEARKTEPKESSNSEYFGMTRRVTRSRSKKY